MHMVRRRRRTTETTQLEILQAAEQLFAEKGFAETSLSAIAERAHVAKSLIHHHFGSKEELWGQVKKTHMRDYQALRHRLIAENGHGTADIGAAIRAHFAFLSDRPRMVRIFGWMMLETLGEEYAELGGDLIKLAAAALQRAQDAGRIRQDFQPVFAVLTFVSATEHWLRVREKLAPTLLNVDLKTADDWFVGNLVDIIVHGVNPTTPVTPDALTDAPAQA